MILDPTTEAPEPMSEEEVCDLKQVQKISGARIDVVWGGVTLDIEGAELSGSSGAVQLKKGDTYSRHLGSIRLEEHWSFQTANQVQYLDATCFIYDKNHNE